jgi:DNA polymerase V
MKAVSFVRTSPKELGEQPSGEGVLCAYCGQGMNDGVAHADTDGYVHPLSLDELLVKHPSSTFFVQVGDEQAAVSENEFLGVRSGDILTIDRTVTPTLGKLVLAVCDGGFSLCRFTEHAGRRYLVCGNSTRTAREVREEHGVQVWGVVSALSRRL